MNIKQNIPVIVRGTLVVDANVDVTGNGNVTFQPEGTGQPAGQNQPTYTWAPVLRFYTKIAFLFAILFVVILMGYGVYYLIKSEKPTTPQGTEQSAPAPSGKVNDDSSIY